MDVQSAKNALVASLFELSNAASDAASATVNFYKVAGFESASASGNSLAILGETISEAAKTASQTFSEKAPATETTQAVSNSPATETTEPAQTKSAGNKGSTSPVPAPAASPEKKEKAKRKRKDPNAPKKPLTTYLRYNLFVRELLKEQRSKENAPTLPAPELNRIIAQKWADLSEAEKAKLQKDYDSEFEEYRKALDAYKLKKIEEGDTNEEPADVQPAPKKKSVEGKKDTSAKAAKAPAKTSVEAAAPAENKSPSKTAAAPAENKSPSKTAAAPAENKSPSKTAAAAPVKKEVPTTATESSPEAKKKASKKEGAGSSHSTSSAASGAAGATSSKKSKKKHKKSVLSS